MQTKATRSASSEGIRSEARRVYRSQQWVQDVPLRGTYRLRRDHGSLVQERMAAKQTDALSCACVSERKRGKAPSGAIHRSFGVCLVDCETTKGRSGPKFRDAGSVLAEELRQPDPMSRHG